MPGGKVLIGREVELRMKRKAKGVSEVLEKDPDGFKIPEINVFVSNSEVKAEKEQPKLRRHLNYLPRPCCAIKPCPAVFLVAKK